MFCRISSPRARALLTVGTGVTLAVTQLGAGCGAVDYNKNRPCDNEDAGRDDAGYCNSRPLWNPDAGGAKRSYADATLHLDADGKADAGDAQ